jgi:hypothetical protein
MTYFERSAGDVRPPTLMFPVARSRKMARMKRVVNRYGKITLASLGGCLVSIGAFLIVLSSLTVTNVARADECQLGGSPIEGWNCTAYYEGGQWIYYCCPAAPCPTPAATCDSGCNGESGFDGPTQSCGTGSPTNYKCGQTPNTCISCRCTGTASIIGGQTYITCNCQ